VIGVTLVKEVQPLNASVQLVTFEVFPKVTLVKEVQSSNAFFNVVQFANDGIVTVVNPIHLTKEYSKDLAVLKSITFKILFNVS